MTAHQVYLLGIGKPQLNSEAVPYAAYVLQVGRRPYDEAVPNLRDLVGLCTRRADGEVPWHLPQR